ncbi:MAG: hypothetical protein FJ197_00460 [Gammaproteobacteria bacterium]|nr:hypothetical protein [Gammaproteobacteria bacterium]
MQKIAALSALAALAAANTAAAACAYPPEIDVPNGARATKDEMVAANAAVKGYMAQVEEYLACLDREEADLGDAVTDEQKQLHTTRHNTAVDALNAVAARYNEQVQAYKKAGGK